MSRVASAPCLTRALAHAPNLPKHTVPQYNAPDLLVRHRLRNVRDAYFDRARVIVCSAACEIEHLCREVPNDSLGVMSTCLNTVLSATGVGDIAIFFTVSVPKETGSFASSPGRSSPHALCMWSRQSPGLVYFIVARSLTKARALPSMWTSARIASAVHSVFQPNVN